MQISKISAANGVQYNSTVAFSAKQQAEPQKTDKQDIFEQYSAKKLPDNKAIQIGHRPGLSLVNVLLIPFGFWGFSIKPTMKVVDIDKDNLTPKQEKMIRKGKLIDYVPRGYHVEGNKVKKNK
ncbi:hypothetical protein IJ182_10000 [bacterium]|nr:hypothetical protein [bacterium]